MEKLHTSVLYLVFSDSIVFLPSASNSSQKCFKLYHHLLAYPPLQKTEKDRRRKGRGQEEEGKKEGGERGAYI